MLYVALTRARRSVVLFTVRGRRSPFLTELVRGGFVPLVDTDGETLSERPCPGCEDGLLVRHHGPYGPFLGCDRFPACHTTRRLPPFRPSPERGRGRVERSG